MKKVILSLSVLAVLGLSGCASTTPNVVSTDCCSNATKLNLAESPTFDNRFVTVDVRQTDEELAAAAAAAHFIPSMTIDAKILFAFDKAVLTSEGKHIIATLADMTPRDMDKPIQLVGSTDFFGSDIHNEKLAENRAIVVRNEFIKNGVPANKIAIKIYLGQKEQEVIDNCKGDLKECVAPDRNTSMLIKLDM